MTNSITLLLFVFLCFAKVCLSHRSQAGTKRGLGTLQHSLWPDVRSNRLALWVLCESMNFHPDKQLFQVAGTGDRTTDPCITSTPAPRGLTQAAKLLAYWQANSKVSTVHTCQNIWGLKSKKILANFWQFLRCLRTLKVDIYQKEFNKDLSRVYQVKNMQTTAMHCSKGSFHLYLFPFEFPFIYRKVASRSTSWLVTCPGY